jgi:hypothetical protein
MHGRIATVGALPYIRNGYRCSAHAPEVHHTLKVPCWGDSSVRAALIEGGGGSDYQLH